MRPTARVRHNPLLRTTAKLCRQYLKWFGNSSYRFERNGERWLLATLRRESIRTVLDVGANDGTWSLMAAELFPNGMIHALEIVPETPAALRARVGQHDRIKCFDFGLAAHTGRLPIRYYAPANRHATFIDFPRSWTGEWIECPVMRGDEFLAQEGIPAIDFLKLDVEGAEHLVLQGLEANLRKQRVRFVQFEYGQKDILTDFLLRDFYQLFASYGYIVGKIFPDYVEFRDYELKDEDFFGSNYLACPAGIKRYDAWLVRLHSGRDSTETRASLLTPALLDPPRYRLYISKGNRTKTETGSAMRSVLFVDPPAFCTAVEGLVTPKLRSRPVAVAPPGADRATILALSGEARLAGIERGMPVRQALKRCPDLVLLPPNPRLYAAPRARCTRCSGATRRSSSPGATATPFSISPAPAGSSARQSTCAAHAARSAERLRLAVPWASPPTSW